MPASRRTKTVCFGNCPAVFFSSFQASESIKLEIRKQTARLQSGPSAVPSIPFSLVLVVLSAAVFLSPTDDSGFHSQPFATVQMPMSDSDKNCWSIEL